MTLGRGEEGATTAEAVTGARFRDVRAYQPAVPPSDWDEIAGFLSTVLARCQHRDAYSEYELLLAAAPLVLWCRKALASSLDERRIFVRSTVDFYVGAALKDASTATRSTMRARLLCICDCLAADTRPRKMMTIGRADPSTPYTDKQVAQIYSWASQQRAPIRRRSAIALAALGLGAGLPTREVLAIYPRHVHLGSGNATVFVPGDHERRVPLSASWASLLAKVVHEYDPRLPLFCPHRTNDAPIQVSNFVKRTQTELDIRPARMRATWVRDRLMEGLPALDLLVIAGFRNFASLDKWMRFLPPNAAPSWPVINEG